MITDESIYSITLKITTTVQLKNAIRIFTTTSFHLILHVCAVICSQVGWAKPQGHGVPNIRYWARAPGWLPPPSGQAWPFAQPTNLPAISSETRIPWRTRIFTNESSLCTAQKLRFFMLHPEALCPLLLSAEYIDLRNFLVCGVDIMLLVYLGCLSWE